MKPHPAFFVAIILSALVWHFLGLVWLVGIALALVVGFILLCVILELIYGHDDGPRLRQSYDHDKETPPKGWNGGSK